jgi:hypothetical protein
MWAIESAGGLGHLLAQQLVAAGETVVDVPATLASRFPKAHGRVARRLGLGPPSKPGPATALCSAL